MSTLFACTTVFNYCILLPSSSFPNISSYSSWLRALDASIICAELRKFVLGRLHEQDTHFCFSILLFSFTLVCPPSLFPLCVETIFIPRVPQSRHNWRRNARSESINPFYPSVTPLHGPPQFIFPAQNRALLYSTLL